MIGRAHYARTFLLTAAVILVSGCSSYRDPMINITEARLGQVTNEALVLTFAVDLLNPNEDALKLLEFKYDVSVDGVKAYEGTRAARQTLAANGQRQTDLPAVVRYDDMRWTAGELPAEVAYTIDGSLRYVTPGEIAQILLDSGVRRPAASFRQSGRVRLRPR